MPDFNQAPKNDMPIDEIPFSPTTFINNNSNVNFGIILSNFMKGFNFNQPFDDTLYRN